MNISQARALLSTTFANSWGATTPITYSDTLPDTPGTAWVRFTVQNSGSHLQSWNSDGGQNWCHYGLVVVQILVRAGTGTIQADTLAEQVKTILMGKWLASGEMKTFEAEVREDGPDGFGWNQTRVLIRFEYKQTTT